MKYLIFASLFLFIAAFNNEQTIGRNISIVTTTQDTAAIIAGEWELMPVMPSDTATGTIPQLNFDLVTKKFSGNTGCNTMQGSFVINKDALNFGADMVSTKMACQGYNEKAFIDNLLKTNRYEIKDGVLQLMYNTTILSKWVRHVSNIQKAKQA
jgi:heat shock protein HslJ